MVGEGVSVRVLIAGHIVSTVRKWKSDRGKAKPIKFQYPPKSFISSIVTLPHKSSTTFQNSTTKWRPSVQTQKLMGETFHTEVTPPFNRWHTYCNIKNHEEKGQNYYILSLQIHVLQIQGPVWNRHVMTLPRRTLVNAWIETCNGLVLFWNSSFIPIKFIKKLRVGDTASRPSFIKSCLLRAYRPARQEKNRQNIEKMLFSKGHSRHWAIGEHGSS